VVSWAGWAARLLGYNAREEQAAATADAGLARGYGLKEEGNRVGRKRKALGILKRTQTKEFKL
jgi:hypothetical protein